MLIAITLAPWVAGTEAGAMPQKAKPGRGGAARRGKGDRYHHGDLRRAILNAALEISAQDGPGALTLRAIAGRTGVTAAAPYRHFTSKDALLAAVAEEGFRMLSTRLRERMAAFADDPLRLYQECDLAYVLFALENPA